MCASWTRGGTSVIAAGCNLGAGVARGDVLVFLNPDTVVAPGALERLAATVEDPAIGIAMARLRLLDRPELLNSSGSEVHVSGISWAGGYGEPAESVSELRDVPAPSGAAMAIRADTFRKLGGFTDELFMYQEDLLLGWKARLAGLRVVIEPGADVYHDYEFGRNVAKHYLLERNRLVFVLSSYSPRLLLLLSPVLLSTELAMTVLAAREGWFRDKLRGWAWCARNARWLARQRRETQRLRRVPDRDLAPLLSATLIPRDDLRSGRGEGREPARGGLLAARPPCAVTELSVVLVNHNGAECLPGALRALAANTVTEDVECIVVDSASTDGSWEEVERHWDRARALRFEENIGFCRGLQPRCGGSATAGSSRSSTSTARSSPGWDAPLRELLGRRRRLGRDRAPPRRRRRDDRGGWARDRAQHGHLRARRGAAASARRRTAPVDVTAASGALMMVRREEFLALGGFYEPIWMYGEEADYCLRVPGRVVLHPRQRDPPRATAHAAGPAALADAAVLGLAQPARQCRPAPAGAGAGASRRRLGGLRRADPGAGAQPLRARSRARRMARRPAAAALGAARALSRREATGRFTSYLTSCGARTATPAWPGLNHC